MLRSCVLGFIYRWFCCCFVGKSCVKGEVKTLQTTNQRENHQLRNTEQPAVASSAHLLLFCYQLFVLWSSAFSETPCTVFHRSSVLETTSWRFFFFFLMFLHCYQNLSHAEEVQSVDESGRADPYSAFNILLHMKPDVGLLAQFCMILFSVSLSLLQLHTSLVENHYSTKSLLNHIWK